MLSISAKGRTLVSMRRWSVATEAISCGETARTAAGPVDW